MRRARAVNAVLGLAAVGVVVAATASVGSPAPTRVVPRTTKASLGVVQSMVTATGNVQASRQLSVSFTTGGRLTEVDASPGQHVAAGDVLAKVDDATARSNLTTAQANLDTAQARLTQLDQGLTAPEQAQNDAAAAQAQVAVDSATSGLDNARRVANANAVTYQVAVDAATAQLNRDRSQPGNDQAVAKDQDALTTALNNQRAGLARDRQSLDTASHQLDAALASQRATLAGNAVKAQPPKVGDQSAAQAAVTSAQAAMTAAQKAVDDTVLRSPADGVVVAVSASVGETVGGGGGGSSSSSGSSGASGSSGTTGSGAAGGAGGTSSSGTTSSGGTSSGGTSSGGTSSGAFITVTDLGTMEVKASLPEVDAAKVKVGQAATLSFDALPTDKAAGHVTSVDTMSTVVSNVVTYNAVVSLDQSVTGLKPGMTATAAIVVGERDNVVRVPAAAVQGTGATGRATVMQGQAQRSVTVTVGLRGDDAVEITSGLSAGDDVVISTGTAVSGAAGATTGAGGLRGGGLGGGGLGGGGLGGAGGFGGGRGGGG